MNELRMWSELEPHEWGGSLATIQRAETEVLRNYEESTEKAGTYWVSATTELFRFGCPADQIAGFMTERLLEYTELARVRRFGPVEFDQARAAQRMVSTLYACVKANTEEIYSFGGQRLTAILYYAMTQNIRKCYGSDGICRFHAGGDCGGSGAREEGHRVWFVTDRAKGMGMQ